MSTLTRISFALAAVVLAGGACSRNSNRTDNTEPRSPNTATSAEWAGQAAGRAEELFVGRFPGVQVFQEGGGISVRIRGITSINGSSEPLYVIDGMTIEPGPGGALMGINPADIEKIEVLKDIGSTAIYGSRGGNGVILIHTSSRGSKRK